MNYLMQCWQSVKMELVQMNNSLVWVVVLNGSN